MANWNKERVTPEQINGGNEFTPNDNLSVTELNAIVNNSFFSAETATEAKEIAESAKEASDNFVSYATQTPTDAQKQQARENIGAVAKVTNPINNNFVSLDANGNLKNSGVGAYRIESLEVTKANNPSSDILYIDWANFNAGDIVSSSTAGNFALAELGTWSFRADVASDTSGLVSSLGFTGTVYSVEFTVWDIGTPDGNGIFDIATKIKISDALAIGSTSNYAEANVLLKSQGTYNISASFVQPLIGKVETVWSNSNVANTQAEQTVNATKDLQQYKGFIILYNRATDAQTTYTFSQFKEHNTAYIKSNLAVMISGTNYQRAIDIDVGNNKIVIGTGYKQTAIGSYATDNTKLILKTVRGVK